MSQGRPLCDAPLRRRSGHSMRWAQGAWDEPALPHNASLVLAFWLSGMERRQLAKWHGVGRGKVGDEVLGLVVPPVEERERPDEPTVRYFHL